MIDELWKHVDIRGEDECWLWKKNPTAAYGVVCVNGYREAPHRLSYAIKNGDPGRLMVRHTCDVMKCVNPRHLLKGTCADNVRDMIERGRKGHNSGWTLPFSSSRIGLTEIELDKIVELLRKGDVAHRIGVEFSINDGTVRHIAKAYGIVLPDGLRRSRALSVESEQAAFEMLKNGVIPFKIGRHFSVETRVIKRLASRHGIPYE
jgi:hypothetical protein